MDAVNGKIDRAIRLHEGKYHRFKEKPETNKKILYNESFERFWKGFKGRWNVEKGIYDKGSKFLAAQEFYKLSDEEKERAIYAAPFSGGKFTKDCVRWLKEKWFDNWEKK